MITSGKKTLWGGRRDFLKRIIAAGVGISMTGWSSGEARVIMRVGDIPPKITLMDLKGNPVTLPGYFQGKVAVLHFWASWCATCRTEMVVLESLYLEYGKRGLVPCSIDVGESQAAALSYIKDMKISYPVFLDPNSLTVKQFGVSGVPTFYVFNRQGTLCLKILGEVQKDGLEKFIRTLL
jgi:cytochrome c biogenesis protein CcmG, thiol:disulfide interchange protein DsbE